MSDSKRITEDMKPIHESKDYAVYVGDMLGEGELQGQPGYLMYNKRTGVVEGELNVEFAAIRTLHEVQTQLDAALEKKGADENTEEKFDDFLKRLGEHPE